VKTGKLIIKDLEREKAALADYRNSMNQQRAQIGAAVFDSGK
jgi:hypothetical protein